MNETVCGDGRVERRSAYGGDASLVLSQIHRKNLREQRRGGDRFTLWDFFFQSPHFIFFSEVSFRLMKVMAGTGVAKRDDFERQKSSRVSQVSRADSEWLSTSYQTGAAEFVFLRQL